MTKFILSTRIQQIGIKPDGIKSKTEYVEGKISFFLEVEENQIIIVEARHLLSTDKIGRETYTCNGIGYVKITEHFYGYLNHAISAYIQMVLHTDDIHCDLDVLKKIQNVFDELSKRDDILKLIETFRK